MDRGSTAGPAAIGRSDPAGPILLYDGTCGLCDASVQWILRRDRRGTLRFAPLQGETAASLRRAHPEIGQVDSVVWVEPGASGQAARALVRSDAALRVAAYLGGIWSLAGVASIVPRGWRDAIYAQVAKHRHHLAGAPACAIPTGAERERFLP